MSMTHYMELLATHQPWNLLLFMAIPIVLAETVAITELYLLFTRRTTGRVKALSRFAGIAGGLYFAGIIAYLLPNVILPVTESGGWRGPIDIVAVSAYLLSGLPLILIALQEMRVIDRTVGPETRLARHAVYVGIFLVLAHIGMIAGMMDPSLISSLPVPSHADASGMEGMGGMMDGGMMHHPHGP